MKRIGPNGKLYTVRVICQLGNGVAGKIRWEISSVERLNQEETEQVIEGLYPFAGYGASTFRRMNKLEGRPFEIEVESNASCD